MPHNSGYFSACLASYVVLLNDENKVFMLRRQNTVWQSGSYNVPAGKVERHETFVQAAVREAKEEAGVGINTDDLNLFLVQNRHKADEKESASDWVDFFFFTRTWVGEPHIAEPEKSDTCGWFAINDDTIPVIPNIKEALAFIDKGKISFQLFCS